MVVFLPRDLISLHTTGSTDLDVESVDTELLATGSNILSSQHGSVGRRLVTVSLDLHTTGDTADGFATTVTQVLVRCLFRISFSISGTSIFHGETRMDRIKS